MVLEGSAALEPARQAAPYPRGAVMTRAPACAAIEAVASALPLLTTMHSAIRCHGISATTWPMDSASFKAGMMMEIGGGIRRFSSCQTIERQLLAPVLGCERRTQR